MRRTGLALLVMLASSTVAIRPAHARGFRGGAEDGQIEQPSGGLRPVAPGDTVTFYCVDLNNVWQVAAPVIVARLYLDYDLYSQSQELPFPDPGCSSGFPVVVPAGSRFTPGGTFVWYTNHAYPRAVRDALAARGYRFRSQSPAEDFLAKIATIRVEVRTLGNQLVADYSFDARTYFKRTLMGIYWGMMPLEPHVNPDLGIQLSADAVRRLPLMGFPVLAGPLPAGTPPGWYSARVFWTLSEEHNDGLGLDEENFLPASEFPYGFARFVYAP